MKLLEHRLRTLAVSAVLVVPLVAGAQELIGNGSFENVPFSLGANSFCYTAIDCAGTVPSWSGDFVLMQSTSSFWNATPNTPTDQYHVGLQGTGYFEQQVSFTAPGLYKLSWFDAGRSNISGNQTYALFLDGVPFYNTVTTTGQDWTAQSVLFQVENAGLQTLRFEGREAGNHTAFIDNLSLVTAVPEPSTWALTVAGLVATAFGARRRQT